MPVLTRDDVEIHWTERGDSSAASAVPLVLVHGLTASSRMFERLAAELDHRWIILVDVRGHGTSSEPTDPDAYTWTHMVADVLAVLDRLDVDEAVVGGTSLGADVALAFADAHPERTAGLILEMPVLLESEGFARSLFGPAATVLGCLAPVLAPIMRTIGRVPVPRFPELVLLRDVLSHDPLALAAVFRGLLRSDQPDTSSLGHINAPTLVIGHRHDRLHAIADAHHVANDIAGAELVEAPSFLHYRIRVGELATLVDDFLTRHDL